MEAVGYEVSQKGANRRGTGTEALGTFRNRAEKHIFRSQTEKHTFRIQQRRLKNTVDPWTTWIWTTWVHLYVHFFSINLQLALCIPEFHSHLRIQTTAHPKQHLGAAAGNPWVGRANPNHTWSFDCVCQKLEVLVALTPMLFKGQL